MQQRASRFSACKLAVSCQSLVTLAHANLSGKTPETSSGAFSISSRMTSLRPLSKIAPGTYLHWEQNMQSYSSDREMPACVPESPPHPGGKVLDRVQVNTFVGMLDNQQNMMIDIFVWCGAPDWGGQKTYESKLTPKQVCKFLYIHTADTTTKSNLFHAYIPPYVCYRCRFTWILIELANSVKNGLSYRVINPWFWV